MKFETFIAFKHLAKRRKSGFISLISMISTAGVAVGVMALIVVLGVMSGFDRELKAKIVGVQPHLRIEKVGGMDNPDVVIESLHAMGLSGLETAAPFVEGQAILRSDKNALGVVIKGLDPALENLDVYAGKLVRGEINLSDVVTRKTRRFFFFFHRTTEIHEGALVIGAPLAGILRVGIGDRVEVISPFAGDGTSLKLGGAEKRIFVVKGIFKLGMSEFDSGLALIHIEQARGLYHLGNRVSGLSVRFHNVDDAQRWKPVVVGQLGMGYYVRSWYDLNENFFQALKVEKSVMTILLTLIILVASFNIISTLIMVVMEKTRDIGILRALGATAASIRRIFILEGFCVGLMGILLGTGSGLWVALNLNLISDFLKKTTVLEVFPSDIYFFDRISVEVKPQDIAMVLVLALGTSILAGIYPAHRGAKLDPVEALRYE